jgi:Calcineurin-like phosphoesterase
VGSATEYQWQAKRARLRTNTRYCYRVYGDSTDLLGSDPTPSFRSRVPARANARFSFAVFGDWGEVDGDSHNADQARLMQQIAESRAQFAVTTGDTAYESGSQTNYGDLVQTGDDVSSIFGDQFWTVAGDHIAMFNTQGNHGMNTTPLINWPQPVAVSTSHGRYAMEQYCCPNDSDPVTYPSSWYAFNEGGARFYVLETAWGNSNVGSGSIYENDHDAHWTTTRAEYQWVEQDLKTHPHKVAFAFFHFPLYADNASETSDPYLHGSGDLEELLGDHGVDIVFNGHAHIYERNRRSAPGMPVSYVTGGGGGHLEPVSDCDAIDAYAIGWSYSSSTHGSSCGSAPRPSTTDRVFHFLLVTVDGTTVTVRPTDELGRTFDVRTYDFS